MFVNSFFTFSHKNKTKTKEVYSKRRFLTFNRIRYLPTDGKKTFFVRLSTTNFLLDNRFFFAFWLKFRKTKQRVVTFIATALKTLLSVAKTNGRLSGRKFYAGNIVHFFWNILAHISPIHIQKVRQPKLPHRKTQTPIVAKQSLNSIGSL